MAWRGYLSNSSPVITPTAKGIWTSTTSSVSRGLTTSPSGSNTTVGIVDNVSTNPNRRMLGIFTYAIPNSGTLSGVVSWAIGFMESSANANMFLRLHMYVLQGTSSTLRGTLLANYNDVTEGVVNTLTGMSDLDIAISSVAVTAGDTLVVEVGYEAQNGATTSYTGTLSYGGTGTLDLMATDTTVTTRPCWVQFSDPNQVLKTISSYPKNLCISPTCVDATRWVVGTVVTGTPQAVTGFSRSNGLHCTVGSTGNPGIHTPRCPVSVGEVVSAYVELKGSSTNPYTVWFNIRDANYTFLTPNPSASVVLSSTVQQVEFENITMPANALYIDFSIEGSGVSGDVVDVSCVRYDLSSRIYVYGDGDGADWVWDGSSGASSSRKQSLANPLASFAPFFA